MKTTAIMMAGLCVIATLAVASPAMAEEGEEENRSCVTIYEKPPDVAVDIPCLIEVIHDIIGLEV